MRFMSLVALIACAHEPALVADEEVAATSALDSSEPSRLLDLTHVEVAELATGYGVEVTALDRAVAAPFDCATCGDHCAIAGP